MDLSILCSIPMGIGWALGILGGTDGQQSDTRAVNLLTGTTRSRFEYCRLAIQLRFVNLGKRDMTSSQQVLHLDSGKAQHLRNLVKGKSLVAIAL